MGKNPNLYNILKMQQDDAKELLGKIENSMEKNKSQMEDDYKFNEETLKKLEENKAWLESLGISLDNEKILQEKNKAKEDIDEILDKINNKKTVYEKKDISYEDLILMAKQKGYSNVRIEELLTQEEIQEADRRFNEIENEFKLKTKLNKIDMVFLGTAIAMQVIRQYIITPLTEKNNASEASKVLDKRYVKDGKLRGKYYYATEDTIIKQRKVPFDVIAGSKKFNLGKDGKGLDGNHRFRSLGHDPILGYIFGTANIVTNTATWWNFTSHHIRYVPNISGIYIPAITSNANTGKIFEAVIDRYKSKNGKKILVEAIIKQHLHLKSDISTAGLPIPLLQTISPDLVQTLAEFGIDGIFLSDVFKQTAGAELINFIISTVHSLLCQENGELDIKIYQVRTRKIILISNLIATTSNLIANAVKLYFLKSESGDSGSGNNPLKYVDFGGLLVTIIHLFTDLRFMYKVKKEFIQNNLDQMLMIELNNLDKYLEI